MKYLLTTLKRAFKNNPFLYNLWFVALRSRTARKKIKFFTKETEFFITGFTRTGNTYATFLVKTCIPSINFVHHLHTVASIKIALNRKIPVVVLLRDPLGCIASNYLKFYSEYYLPERINKTLISRILIDYIDYHKFILNNRHKIDLISFDEIKNNPVLFVKNVSDKTGVCLSVESIENTMRISSSKFRGARDILGASLPNSTKEREKALLIDAILSMKEMQQAKMLFKELNVSI